MDDPPSEVEASRDYVSQMLSNVTEYDVIVDAIRPHVNDGKMVDDMTDAFLYAFERNSGLLVPGQVPRS